jgi:hypothetical protein
MESMPNNTDVQDKVFAFLANPATHPGIRYARSVGVPRR